jgi:tetratricopeptide (TPR) repeat protein
MEAARLGERSADFYFNVGLTHLDRRDYEAARAVLLRACELSPDDAEIRYHLAKVYYESLCPEEARDTLSGWERWRNLSTRIVANISQLLTNLGEPGQAEPALRRALRDPAIEPEAMPTLVQVLERTNQVSEAEALLREAEHHPDAGATGTDLVVAKAILSQRSGLHEQACALFRDALRSCDSFDKRHFQLFPLAKSLDALGNYDEAFETLREAHRSYRAHLQLTHPLLAATGAAPLLGSRAGCSAADLASWDSAGAPSAQDSPVFLVGFPRSGTTLLELALDAHPNLRSMDEQPFLQTAMRDLEASGARYPAELGGLSTDEVAAVREKYWRRVQRRVHLDPGQRLVDKNPMNMAALPAIMRLFPHARVLLALRQPCDVLLSCYMQHFRAPDFALLCNDLQTLARGHRRAFDFWYEQAALLGPAVIEVRYEELTRDFPDQMRRILEFLELPWTDEVLRPAERASRKRFISTPSYAQVANPVTTSSVDRWKPYARYFVPVMSELQTYLDRWGYEASEARGTR